MPKLRCLVCLGLLAAAPAGLAQTGTPSITAASPEPLRTSFKDLAGFPIPDSLYNAKPGHVIGYIPKRVRELDGKRVALTGFMLPVTLHNHQVTAFLLMRTQNTCCFGIAPLLNEVVEVTRMEAPARILMDTPITVVGRLHVRERWGSGFLCSIYQLDEEQITQE